MNEAVPLKEHFESRLAALEKQTELAAQLMDKRLESMNEFRAQLRDQASTFATRTEYTLQHQRVLEDIRSLRESLAELHGKASQSSVMLALAIAIGGLLLSAVALVHAFGK